MKTKFLFLAMLMTALAAPQVAFADDDDDSDSFTTRYSVGGDYKIDKGLHLYANEELRLNKSFGFDRTYTTVGLSYKVNPYFKISGDYVLIGINGFKFRGTTYDQMDWRHRLSFTMTGMYKVDRFKLSLRNRTQATIKSTDQYNQYQTPKTVLVNRTRFKVAYDIPNSKVEPYASVEARLFLNGAKYDSNWTTSNYASAEYLGHSDVYLNRVRTQVGADWKIDKHNAVEFYGIYDYLIDKDIDAKYSTGLLKAAVTKEKSSRFAIGIGYVYSF